MPDQNDDPQDLDELVKELRRRFEQLLDEPVPDDIKKLLDELEGSAGEPDQT